jgi:hypothetical protein
MHKYVGMYSFLGRRFDLALRDQVSMMKGGQWTVPVFPAAAASILVHQLVLGRVTRARVPMV